MRLTLTLTVAVYAMVAGVCPAFAEVSSGQSIIRGVLKTIDPSSLIVRTSDGRNVQIPISPNAEIALGRSIGRWDLQVGRTVAITGLEIRLPDQTFMIGEWFTVVDPGVPPVVQKDLLTRLMPPPTRVSDPAGYETMLIVGRLVSVDHSRVAIEKVGSGPISIKLTPEAEGQSLRLGHWSDLRQGVRLLIPTVDGKARTVLILDSPRT